MRRVTSAEHPVTPRTTLSNALTCGITAALLIVPTTAAAATPLPEPEDVPRSGAALTAPTPFANAPLASGRPVEISEDVTHLPLDDDGDAIVTRLEEQRIAPGLELTRFARMGEDGWLSGEVLVADLGSSADGTLPGAGGRASGAGGRASMGGLQVGYVGPDHIAGNATVSQMAASRGAIAAINGDYFDINNSGAALGAAVDDGTLIKSASPGRERSVAIGPDGVGRLAQLFLEGSVSWKVSTSSATDGSTEFPVSGLNVTALPAGGVAVYDAGWGTFTRARPLAAGEQGVEVWVDADGTVTAVGQPAGGQLPDGTRAVVARPGAAADALATLAPGDRVDLDYGLREDAADVAVAIGGGVEDPLLEDGEVTSATGDHVELRHPRTAVGFDESGTRAYFVVVDGRQTHSIGMNLYELGELMAQLGADDAINLDGGGSSEMVARLPGDAGTTILNSPSDGYERSDANGLGLFVPAGSGRVSAFDVRTTVPAADADRVFPGLHRTLVGKGYDDAMGPVDTEPSAWRTRDGSVASVRDGVVTGRRPGSTVVTAATLSRWGLASGTTEVEVLGPLVRTGVATPVIGLADADATAPLVLTGYDAQGFAAPIEARDVTVTGGDDVAELVPAPDGSFEVRALAPVGGTTFELSVPGPGGRELTTEVAVTVSLEEEVVADFADAASWTSAHDRAPGGSVAPATGHDGAGGLRMTYDFTQSTATRGQYAVLPEAASGGRELPGSPRAVTMWVDGDGNGAWLRLQVRQGDGVVTQLDGPEVTWTGWRQVTFPVPDGVAFPLKLQRVRALETTAGQQYSGGLTLSAIAAQVPPDVDAPEAPRVEDPTVAADGGTDGAPLRVAVMSDAQFVARNPESGAVAGARDALREIVADDPDLLVINGDLVDEAAPEDFDLARRILTEELADADFPWYYVPGNHEVMGGSIANFEEEFGERTRVLDVPTPGRAGGTTRLVMLDSSAGRLGADFAQVRMLREALDDAATDRSVTGVVVFAHHPLDDPLPTKASQLTDRLEADTLRGWYEDFEETSGKSIASVNAHAGVFHASTQDGVPYLVNGNSGKGPASTPADGGFTGWSMLGLRPASGTGATGTWLSWEVNTRAEGVTVTGPESLRVGDSAAVSAVVVQDDTREVPVAWPVSSAWGGERVCTTGETGRAALWDCPRGTVLALDPDTHEVTALRAGEATVTVTVNGQVGELAVGTTR
ncbi:phosphodiester glycosidase family protein [Promicromonospora panici]|uniref:phosphodiester glycosidase family protein n=1 Tax=Promicromonospora panici TaxID=2219658 RepID=UPI001F5D9AF0|nr:phosphodiester glycosidase family protein [Promicromonospora panici]